MKSHVGSLWSYALNQKKYITHYNLYNITYREREKLFTKSHMAAGIKINGLKFWSPSVSVLGPVLLERQYNILNVSKQSISPRNIAAV